MPKLIRQIKAQIIHTRLGRLICIIMCIWTMLHLIAHTSRNFETGADYLAELSSDNVPHESDSRLDGLKEDLDRTVKPVGKSVFKKDPDTELIRDPKNSKVVPKDILKESKVRLQEPKKVMNSVRASAACTFIS